MRMPHLQTLVPPSTSRRRNRVLLLSLVTGLTVLGANDLSAQTSDADIAELRAQMQQMQEDNAKMAAQMQQMQENNAKWQRR